MAAESRPFRDTEYQMQISHEAEAPDWDSFVASVPGGHHVQTSLWAQIKALLGWRVVRAVVTHHDHIVGGVQVLIRQVPFIGAIGYVTKGPLIASDDPVLLDLVMNELEQIRRWHRLQCLIVQPPNNGETLAARLPSWGFRSSMIEVAPTATVLIDLTQSIEVILGSIHKKARHNIHRGLRRGSRVREGTECDLQTFCHLMMLTSQRQKFIPYPEEYVCRMWRILHPHGYVKMFLAEYEGEAVSALLVIPFGDTVLAKKAGWSGCHPGCHPNEVLHWAAIKWAKLQGYHYYDFEGIEPAAAEAILNGKPLPESLRQTVTSFKLRFGGTTTLYPGPYECIYNPLLHWIYTRVYPTVGNWPVMDRTVSRFVRR